MATTAVTTLSAKLARNAYLRIGKIPLITPAKTSDTSAEDFKKNIKAKKATQINKKKIGQRHALKIIVFIFI